MGLSEDVNILLVDDNEDILFMLKAMLSMKGYRVTIRTNPLKLEADLKNSKPAAIIMDMLLSGADGRDICRQLKANNELSSIPIIMISAHPTAKEDCLEAGANYFLSKPFDMQNLLGVVKTALS